MQANQTENVDYFFEVSLPWGIEAISDHAGGCEVSTLLLQQSIIADLQMKQSELTAELQGKALWHQSAIEKNKELRAQIGLLENENRELSANCIAATATVAAQQAETDRLGEEINQLNARLASAISEPPASKDEETKELKSRLNEAAQLIANQRTLIDSLKLATDKAASLATQESGAAEKARAVALNLAADLKRTKERNAIMAAGLKSITLEPMIRIEGKGQLILMEGNEVGLFSEMKKMLGTGQPLWWWVEENGYGHPIGLDPRGQVVTGEKSRSYFERRIGKPAREAVIAKMNEFNSDYFNKLMEIAHSTYAVLAIRGTTLAEDALAFIRGLELLPQKDQAQAQIDTLNANLVAIHRETEKAEGRFQLRVCRNEQGKSAARAKQRTSSKKKKRK